MRVVIMRLASRGRKQHQTENYQLISQSICQTAQKTYEEMFKASLANSYLLLLLFCLIRSLLFLLNFVQQKLVLILKR